MRRLVCVVAGLPTAAIVAFYAFVVVVRLWVGQWPSYGHPDAGIFSGVALVADIAVFVLLAAAAVSAILFGLVVLVSPMLEVENLRLLVRVFAVSWVLWLWSVWLDLGDFYECYVD